MSAIDMQLQATMADGSEHTVMVGNPDRVRYDLTRNKHQWPGAADAPFLMTTFMAWSAMQRTGAYTGTWEDFSQRDCVGLDTEDDAEVTTDTP